MVAQPKKKKRAKRRTLDENGIFHDYEGPRKAARGRTTLTKLLNTRVISRDILVEDAMEIMDLKKTMKEKDWEGLEKGDVYLEDLRAKKEIPDAPESNDVDLPDAPYVNWTVAKMKKWLKENGTEFEAAFKKEDLLKLLEKVYVAEDSQPAFDGDDDEF